MPGTTTNFGWPKPLSTDLIAQGADTIGQALDKADAQFMIPVDRYTADEPWTSYPIGISIMAVNTVAANNWPGTSATGSVITFKQASRAHQAFMTASPVSYFWRWYGSTPGPWQTLVGASIPTAFATGGISGATVTPNVVTAIPITFPANRFATPPRFSVTLNVTNPSGWFIAFNPISATGTTVNVFHATATSISFHWQAILGAV
jgi:hypothetical protein